MMMVTVVEDDARVARSQKRLAGLQGNQKIESEYFPKEIISRN